MPCRARDDCSAMQGGAGAHRHDQASVRLTREAGNAAFDLAGVAHRERAHLYSGCCGCCLNDRPLSDSGGIGRLPQNADPLQSGHDLLEKLWPLAAQAVFELSESGGVAARTRQAHGDAGADRIDRLREHDRHGTAHSLQKRHDHASCRDDHIRRKSHQFVRVSAPAVSIVGAPTNINAKVAADAPAEFLHALLERSDVGLGFQILSRCVHEDANAPHALALLRTRRMRPCGCRAAEQRYELVAPHVEQRASSLPGCRRRSYQPATAVAQSVCRISNLPMDRQSVLGEDLNRSESRWLQFGSRTGRGRPPDASSFPISPLASSLFTILPFAQPAGHAWRHIPCHRSARHAGGLDRDTGARPQAPSRAHRSTSTALRSRRTAAYGSRP